MMQSPFTWYRGAALNMAEKVANQNWAQSDIRPGFSSPRRRAEPGAGVELCPSVRYKKLVFL
jgi:hypothetical protein